MMRAAILLITTAFSLLAAEAVAAGQMIVIPAQPAAGEPFVLVVRTSVGGVVSRVLVTYEVRGDVLAVTSSIQEGNPFIFSLPYQVSTVVDGVPPGTYSVAFSQGVPGIPPENLGSVTVGAPAATDSRPQFAGLSGNWFDPAQPGTGVNLVQGDSGSLFGAWLTYAPRAQSDGIPFYQGGLNAITGSPMWLVMSGGRWSSPTRFRGVLYRTRGPSISRPFSTPVDIAPVGIATIDLASAQRGTFSVEAALPNGTIVSTQQAVSRFAF